MYIYIYIYIKYISGYKWSTTQRVLKSHKSKMSVIYRWYIYIYIYIYICMCIYIYASGF